ncbi:HDOD domain-containing protein [Vibrio vulnificus]|nr:HDOD domain-containing protein [Vibrio vulnificus]
MLLANRRYTQEAIETAEQVANEVNVRHAKWLVSMKYILDQSNVDNLLSLQGRYCEDVIFSEDERITRNQRILLECEQAKVVERREQVKARQNTHKRVVVDVTRHAEHMMIEKLLNTPIDKLFNGIPNFDHLASFAYSPSLSFSKLTTLTTLSHQLSSSILDLVTNPKFCERIGKSSKSATDAKIAIGQMGIENCRLLFPVLMARPMLKWSDANTKLIAPKMWQHMIVTANVTRMRLQDANFKEPDAGILIGVLRTVGQFLASNHFTHTFEDALVEMMLKYREQDMREEYYACAEVVANMSFLPKIIFELEGQLAKRVLESMDWPANAMFIKNAVIEDIDNVPVEERSIAGAALAQGRAFSIYDGLQHSNAFVEKHKPYWFAQVQMPGTSLKDIQARMPGRLTLSM